MEKTKDRLESERLLLLAAAKACLDAMNRAVDEGYADHFDCGDDCGAFWYEARAKAEAAIRLAEEL